ncbi:hypothetical protein F5144DRAFT_382347 [Chaetomium tenue]|uniref:Uncharacterized protein n=1 Tax=Chaetomium tenue TaxID=1854479 RepID=A0ACB7NV48_9PEZI|nr:hypothetical protein F5144DRAFT_382347 [Chaetomium globosum]
MMQFMDLVSSFALPDQITMATQGIRSMWLVKMIGRSTNKASHSTANPEVCECVPASARAVRPPNQRKPRGGRSRTKKGTALRFMHTYSRPSPIYEAVCISFPQLLFHLMRQHVDSWSLQITDPSPPSEQPQDRGTWQSRGLQAADIHTKPPCGDLSGGHIKPTWEASMAQKVWC